MARRGRCRCGAILKFHRGPEGYKTRCPECGAVVRLRVEAQRRTRKERAVHCSCGAAVAVPLGATAATCPRCHSAVQAPELAKPAVLHPREEFRYLPTVILDDEQMNASVPPAEAPAVPAKRPRSRTITCEACSAVVPVEASRCPACGIALARTAPAPGLERDVEPRLVPRPVAARNVPSPQPPPPAVGPEAEASIELVPVTTPKLLAKEVTIPRTSATLPGYWWLLAGLAVLMVACVIVIIWLWR
jgi:hypothetical protein